jgi:hypothetical protein
VHPPVAVITHSFSQLADARLCQFRVAVSEDDPSSGTAESFSGASTARVVAVRQPGGVGLYELALPVESRIGQSVAVSLLNVRPSLSCLCPSHASISTVAMGFRGHGKLATEFELAVTGSVGRLRAPCAVEQNETVATSTLSMKGVGLSTRSG